jgi:hypothetical protein
MAGGRGVAGGFLLRWRNQSWAQRQSRLPLVQRTGLRKLMHSHH